LWAEGRPHDQENQGEFLDLKSRMSKTITIKRRINEFQNQKIDEKQIYLRPTLDGYSFIIIGKYHHKKYPHKKISP